MEPSEGHYDWGWLDHAIAEAAKHHVSIVLGTPTAAPPAWLTTKYPETLRIDENGKRDEHGNRAQFSFTSRKYRELAHGIAEAMAKRYGHNPSGLARVAEEEVRHDWPSEHAVDDEVLEPNVRQLRRDSDAAEG
jgi:beta-galactosidase